ncbi:hypothetical protein WA026_019969 [Henosepilachna vigintioctopunctata]|uniref:Kinetochore protein SPC25 n=1 Tax=Henosepilachna vigintioctopunctata TaxID=420089 RepID=A0AAW1UV88_9CUCU
MESNISNLSIRWNNSNSSSSNDAESFSLETELNKKRNFEDQNLKQFKLITSNLTSRYDKFMSKVNSTETYSQYFSAPQAEHYTDKCSKLKYVLEELEMRKTVRNLEEKLKSNLLRNQIISDEVLSLKEKKDVTGKALSIAKKYYSSVWGFNVDIENPLEDRFTCIINFGFASNLYPLKFLIDRNNRDVIDWDGSSLLTIEEETEMKERFSGVDNYLPQVLSELRLILLNKIKMS